MKLNLQKRWIIFDFLFWMAVIVVIILVLLKTITPIYTNEYIVTSLYNTTNPLYPGDQVIQPFSPSYNNLSSFEIAVAYEDTLPSTAQITIQLMHNDSIIMQQPLQVTSIPNCTFLSLKTQFDNCKGEDMYIVITNTSPDNSSSFSLMTTDEELLFLSNTEDYLFNDSSYPERLLCHFTYENGYSYYKPLTYTFWIFLVALLLYCKRKPIINRLNIKPLLP